MTGFRFLCSIFFVIHACGFFIGQAEAVVWRTEQPVNYYVHYASITPVRFLVPSLSREATWYFRAVKSPDDCDHKDISISLQFGSLPLVNPLNETFPEHFYLERTQLAQLSVRSDNVSVAHTVMFPQSGDWYAIGFIPERNDRIEQKGLKVQCEYKFSASLELKELPDHLYLRVNQESQVALTSDQGDGILVGFTVPTSTQAIQVNVKDCSLGSCSLQLSTLVDKTSEMMVENCSFVENVTCTLRLSSPLLGTKHYVNVQLLTEGNATVVIGLESEDCQSALADQSCVLERQLDRYQKPEDFSTEFVRLENSTIQPNEFVLSNDSVTVVPFAVERTTDIGGTLKVKVTFKKGNVLAEDQEVRVCGLVTDGRFPELASVLDLCLNASNSLQVNSSAEGSDGSVSGQLYVPYPEEGLWTVALGMQCYNATNGSSWEVVECVNGTQRAWLNVTVQSCVDGRCGGQGGCKEYIKSSDFIVFSTCDCSAGWRGFGCTDGREALSDSSQLVEVLLLTLSNLFFLPAIVLAVYRRYYVEAIVYFYNMFFSTFYHACDGDRIEKYVYCMTKYSVLATGDFLASTVSLWVTIIAMAQIPIDYTSAIQMAGPLALIIGVLLDRTSLWVIAAPTAVGLALVAVCWVTQCCYSKRCFPEKRRYLWMLPGVLFACGRCRHVRLLRDHQELQVHPQCLARVPVPLHHLPAAPTPQGKGTYIISQLR
ncbi:post-GPI attachment to proteins factor 6-like isoform X2 [Babylonia areolata]|uniref:post-GPI attachment to proteins factor 6-like isoform X2 n=1 Tax=Babylonia areolata TaxID=304850 RepID=UPI003FCF591E